MLTLPFYGTVLEATSYFDNRLHSTVWFNASAPNRNAALIQSARIIDGFAFKGQKTDPEQSLEFPRGTDTEVPQDIRIAAYEISINLLDGRDPEMELESMAVTSEGYSSVRTTYNRDAVPTEHLINGVPSATAWRLIRPYLRDDNTLKLSRVS
jgi:hypothetical protein